MAYEGSGCRRRKGIRGRYEVTACRRATWTYTCARWLFFAVPLSPYAREVGIFGVRSDSMVKTCFGQRRRRFPDEKGIETSTIPAEALRSASPAAPLPRREGD